MAGATEIEVEATVLVVDDEPVVIQVVTELLGSRGLRVISADSGEGALELIAKTPIACLLVDKNLPGIDGLEVMARIRQQQPHCACILMTAFSSTESAVKALRLGANDYLEKPFEDLDLVAEKVDHAIKNQRVRFDRDALAERVREYAAEVAQKNAEVGKHRTESDLLEMVMDARIREATDDLRRKAKILRASLDEATQKVAAAAATAKAARDEIGALDLPAPVKDRLRARLDSIASAEAKPART